MPSFLHVGCGPKTKAQCTNEFGKDSWSEIRFDIDESVNPDIVGSMLNMDKVDDSSVDAVFSSHNIEHLYAHEVPVAIAEFFRVLNDEGYLVITCPDLQSVAKLVAEDKLIETAYSSPAGPISAIDILYGHRKSLASGNLYMAHNCGFTQRILDGTLRGGGFKSVASLARGFEPFFDLWALASKKELPESELRKLALSHFPA